LGELARRGDRVAIVISDITRPTPNDRLVPWMLEELSHVPDEQIVIINGTGTHRDQTPQELEQMLGREVTRRIRVVNHHCQAREELTRVGSISFGCEAWLNREYVAADVRIVTGFIEPHFFAGFSGGPKGIMPGIAGLETIMTFHNARMIGDPRATWGRTADNPLQAMAAEVNRLCPPHFLLNVTLNARKAITGVFAGELFAAHAAGCAFVKAHAMLPVEAPFDVVVTSNSGYPLDQNLYQAVKGMSAARQIVRKGGTILIAAECSDGLPAHGNYASILGMRPTPQELLAMIEEPGIRLLDQWQVHKQAVVQAWADVLVYSSLTEEQVRGALLTPVASIAEALRGLERRYGADMRVAVLPMGPLTIPYVREPGQIQGQAEEGAGES
ncbi:nickel-dependent lactate racemase, partial [Paenibacillus sp. IB182496]